MSAMLPCPGCASPSSICDRAGKTVFYGECDRCGWRGPRRLSEAEAIAAWNRRAPTDARRAAEEMREMAAAHVDCGCSGRADALAATNKGERFVACGNDPCGAIEARAIRALPLPGEEG